MFGLEILPDYELSTPTIPTAFKVGSEKGIVIKTGF